MLKLQILHCISFFWDCISLKIEKFFHVLLIREFDNLSYIQRFYLFYRFKVNWFAHAYVVPRPATITQTTKRTAWKMWMRRITHNLRRSLHAVVTHVWNAIIFPDLTFAVKNNGRPIHRCVMPCFVVRTRMKTFKNARVNFWYCLIYFIDRLIICYMHIYWVIDQHDLMTIFKT